MIERFGEHFEKKCDGVTGGQYHSQSGLVAAKDVAFGGGTQTQAVPYSFNYGIIACTWTHLQKTCNIYK